MFQSISRPFSVAILLLMLSGSLSAGETIHADLLIVGATESGWAAAIQAARLGVKSVVIVHDGEWLGGQFTEQALACVDENKGVGKVGWGVDWHPMKRSFHRSGLFLELMDQIEAFNTEKYGSPMPGRPFHGPSTFRPAEAEAIFRRIIRPYLDSGQIRFITNHYPVAADLEDDNTRLTALHFASTDSRQPMTEPRPELHIHAPLTIDASDWGDVIQVSGAACECGPDPKSRYHEPSAPEDLSNNPHNEMNPITWPMIIEETDQESVIPRPPHFDNRSFARSSRLTADALKGLQWDRPVRSGGILHWPDAGQQSPRQLSIYTVRRIVDGTTSRDGRTSILLNYTLGQDYPLERLPAHVVAALESTEPGASEKNIVEMTRTQRQIIFDDAKQHSLSLLHHLQTFVHDLAPDKTNSFRWFQLSREFGTADHLPPKPYIRESLRLKAMYMMREQDGRNTDGFTKDFAKERFAQVMYPDGIMCWQFHYDFHNTGRAYLLNPSDAGAADDSTNGEHQPDGDPSGPWSDYEKPDRNTRYLSDRSLFPLRSLVPETMNGLLGAQKNLGYSSIVCAAIRLHDQGIAVGQAAGAVAAVSLRNEVDPRDIAERRELLESVRHALCGEVTKEGAAPLLLWPYRDLPVDHPAFVAINRLAALRMLPVPSLEVDFHPDAAATPEWCEQVANLTKEQLAEGTQLPVAHELLIASESQASHPISRGKFCQRWWNQIRSLPLRPWQRRSPNDADNDGIADPDDPTPFTPGEPIVWKIGRPEPHQDGLPDKGVGQHPETRRWNFTTHGRPASDGYTNDVGLPFSEVSGFGWQRDISANNRRRNLLPESIRDTFVFTRQSDTWECSVRPGQWKVTLCLGDAGHDQTGQTVTIEGNPAVNDESTAAGVFLEVSTIVNIRDDRLTIQLGPQRASCNTCLNWLILEPAEPTASHNP